MTLDLSSYSSQELQDALRILRDYRNARKQIGDRAVLQDPRVPAEKALVIEVSQELQSDELQGFFTQVIQKFFPEASGKTFSVRTRAGLSGGMRIFYGDDMVDLSFERFSELVQSFSNP